MLINIPKTLAETVARYEGHEKYAGVDAVDGEWDRKDIVFPIGFAKPHR
jgi:hypothetical protein